MEQDEEQKQPASTRLPAELRLEIWKYYFATTEIKTTSYKSLLPIEKRKEPRRLGEKVPTRTGALISTADISFLKSLPYEEPALLQTCEVFREEALPIYLVRLRKELMKADTKISMARGQWARLHLYTSDSVRAKLVDQIQDLECRLAILAREIARVGQEIERP